MFSLMNEEGRAVSRKRLFRVLRTHLEILLVGVAIFLSSCETAAGGAAAAEPQTKEPPPPPPQKNVRDELRGALCACQAVSHSRCRAARITRVARLEIEWGCASPRSATRS